MSDKPIQNDSEKTRVSKEAIYHEFINWFATPTIERGRDGIETQNQFAELYGVSKDTLSLWKKRADFEDRVNSAQKTWSRGRTPAVLHSIYQNAIKGNARSQKLWLQYFKKFPEKVKKKREARKREFTENDLRFLIAVLPEPLQEKYSKFLRELLDDSTAYNNDDEQALDKSIQLYEQLNEYEKRIIEEGLINDFCG